MAKEEFPLRVQDRAIQARFHADKVMAGRDSAAKVFARINYHPDSGLAAIIDGVLPLASRRFSPASRADPHPDPRVAYNTIAKPGDEAFALTVDRSLNATRALYTLIEGRYDYRFPNTPGLIHTSGSEAVGEIAFAHENSIGWIGRNILRQKPDNHQRFASAWFANEWRLGVDIPERAAISMELMLDIARTAGLETVKVALVDIPVHPDVTVVEQAVDLPSFGFRETGAQHIRLGWNTVDGAIFQNNL